MNTRTAAVRQMIRIIVLIQLLYLGGLGVLSAQDCPALNGVYDFGPLNQNPSDLAAEGSYAYSADVYGLTAYDLSGGGDPVPVGQYLLEQGGSAVSVQSGLAYVGDSYLSWNAGMKILDLADPAAPFLVGSFATADFVHDIVVSGGLVYIAEENSGMEIVDVSDPANPVLLGSFETIGSAYRVCISGSLAYISEGSSGLEIVDVSDPANPVVLGAYSNSSSVNSSAVSGSTAFLANSDLGITILDVSDPSQPVLLGSFGTLGAASSIVVSGGVGYAGEGSSAFEIIDISDPENPALLGVPEDPTNIQGLCLSGISLCTFHSYFGISVFDVTQPEKPVLAGEVTTSGTAGDLVVSGSLAYLADNNFLFQIVDVSNPAAPVLFGSVATSFWPYRISLSGGLVAVLGSMSTLHLIDVSNPAAPIVMGSLEMPGFAHGVLLAGDLAYVSDGDSGVEIIDVSDPGYPTLIGNFPTQGSAGGLALEGHVLGVAESDQNDWDVAFIDISDPYNPALLGTLDAYAQNLTISDGLAYIVGNSSLRIADVSDPSSPAIIGTSEAFYVGRDIVVSGGIATVAGSFTEIAVLDVSDPTNPELLKTVPTRRPNWAVDFDPATSTAWLADEALIEGVSLRCPGCRGLQVAADSETIPTGTGSSTITVRVVGLFGEPLAGATVEGRTNLGELSTFSDQNDGTYTGTLSAGTTPGLANVRITVEGMDCIPSTSVQIECAQGTVEPPGSFQAQALGDTSIQLSWAASSGAEGYRVYRGPVVLGDLSSEETAFVDTSLNPGNTYCYSVAALDPCGEEERTLDVCGTTTGLPMSCPALFATESFGVKEGIEIDDGQSGKVDVRNAGFLRTVGSGIRSDGGSEPSPSVDVGGRSIWGLELAIEGDIAYVAAADAGLKIVEISDPARPVLLGSLDLEAPVSDVVVSSGLAYLANSWAGLQVVDVSDPTDLVILGSWDSEGGAVGIAISGSVVCLADWGVLKIIDVSNPAEPVLLGSVDIPAGNAVDVVVSGSFAYVADGSDGVQVIDISDPNNPALIGNCDSVVGAEAVTVVGNKLYVADHRGLQIVDVTDPSSPTILGEFQTPYIALGVSVSGNIAGVAVSYFGLQMIDVSDPAAPGLLGAANTAGTATDVLLSGGFAFVAEGQDLEIFSLGCRAPQADFSWQIQGADVQFTDGSLYGATSWTWDFGDGENSAEQNPAHHFASGGNYSVSLSVSNAEGSDVVLHDISIAENLFEDGFEGGDTSRWSYASPNPNFSPVIYSDTRYTAPWRASRNSPSLGVVKLRLRRSFTKNPTAHGVSGVSLRKPVRNAG